MKEITIHTSNVYVIGLVEGIKILLKYEPDSELAASHDNIYFCSCEEVSEKDKELLDELGWWFDSSVDSWKYYV